MEKDKTKILSLRWFYNVLGENYKCLYCGRPSVEGLPICSRECLGRARSPFKKEINNLIVKVARYNNYIAHKPIFCPTSNDYKPLAEWDYEDRINNKSYNEIMAKLDRDTLRLDKLAKGVLALLEKD